MNRKKIILALTALFLLSVLATSLALSSILSGLDPSGLPKVDDIYYKGYPGATPDVVVREFLEGETDWLDGPSRSDLYKLVTDAGHKVSSMDPAAEFTFIPINCRDYKERSREPNFPLNDSNFRLALSYIYGMDDKQADISSYYGVPWQEALGNPVPPAQEPWYDETVDMPLSDNATAWAILQSHGYYINTTDNWLYCNGTKLRNLSISYSLGGMVAGASTLGLRSPIGGLAAAFNKFVTAYLGANGPTMVVRPTDFTTLVYDLLVHHDFDFIWIGLTNLGRYIDWTHAMLHSSNDVPWGWNFYGIHDDDFDRWTEIILTSLNETEIIEAASKLQQKFVYEVMPWFPLITGLEFCTLAREADPPAGRGELMNLISMPNYGPSNDWSWMTLHWNYSWPGGAIRRVMGDEAKELNPWTDNTAYSWGFMDRAIMGLLAVSPISLKNMPFIATKWHVENWTSIPELGIEEGATAQFYIRQAVTWHDGRPVTAYDCVANMRFIREYKPGRYSRVWRHLVYEEADGPYKFNVYFDQTSLYYADFVAGTALLAPEHIIEVVEGYWQTWDPSQLAYADLGLGAPPSKYSFMKQIVGCGPYVFNNYDRGTATGRVTRYDEFFVNAPAIASVYGEWRVDPLENYVYQPIAQNVAAKEADANGTLADVTLDLKIYEDEVLAHEVDGLRLDPWNWTYLGPYPIESVACGLHNITVEVCDHTDQTLLHSYTHTFVATVREDLTSYTGELLDSTVDMRDVGRAARAFGSSPGHLRWDPCCDITGDFAVDMRDIGGIARRFGWSCP